MFHPITIPYGCKMLFNIVKLKDGVTIEDIELLLGQLCNTVKNNYGDDNGGFIGGQVFEHSGFVSKEGSLNLPDKIETNNENIGDVVLVTFWNSFEQHEASHADVTFNSVFSKLEDYCESTREDGYSMLWQGVPE